MCQYILKSFFTKKRGYTLVSTRQGYARCSTLAIGKAAVTADMGIGTTIAAQGISVFIISGGHIKLEGCAYGFIGGAGEVDEGKLYFFGDPKTHRDGEKIITAAEAEGLTVAPLSSGKLHDLGGILFINVD